MAISRERETAHATYPADLQTVDDHGSETVEVSPATGRWLAKPATATHLRLQALTQNVRYRLDGGQAAAATGFQLAAGAVPVLLPCPNNGISVAGEAAGAIIEYQWLR